ncbi:MAG: IS481 family transposase [Treponema sp.]|nr:IS481 family transposase [Treponema sp.]
MKQEEKQRLGWVKLYEQIQDAGLTCRRCGISRPTLRKWWGRYQTQGQAGLQSHSRRPHASPLTKADSHVESLILSMRRKRRLGPKRLQSELKRLYDISLSVAVIHKVLTRNRCKPLVRPPRKKTEYKRYSRPIPGERVQMDTCKIKPNLYQYTAIDDCTRYRVLQIYKKRSAENTLNFLEKVIEQMPFPVQRIQTDRGMEFFAEKVQQRLMEYGIKFRPNKPGSPHLNGKVERSQKTDLEEFYPTVDLNADNLEDLLAQWQHYYNWFRPHSSLGGKSPDERCLELSSITPFWDEVENNYHPEKERLQVQNYHDDLLLKKLKGCL